jgi:hypothetical protein
MIPNESTFLGYILLRLLLFGENARPFTLVFDPRYSETVLWAAPICWMRNASYVTLFAAPHGFRTMGLHTRRIHTMTVDALLLFI